jgi:hypothetical protein
LGGSFKAEGFGDGFSRTFIVDLVRNLSDDSQDSTGETMYVKKAKISNGVDSLGGVGV